MAFDVAKAIEALGEAVNSGFSYAERCKKSQSETELIKDWKRQQKAIDYAEKLILVFSKYIDNLSETDQKDFEELFEKFLKYN